MSIQRLSDLDKFALLPFQPGYPVNERTFFSPVDRVHDVLVTMLKSAEHSLTVAMYGFGDDELSEIIMDKLLRDDCQVQLTLDATHVRGHEKKLLEQDRFPSNNIAIGLSEHNAKMHFKAFIVDGLDVVSGSTNWSHEDEYDKDNELTIRRNYIIAQQYQSRIDVVHNHIREHSGNR